jgi:hypothetical protein
MVPPRADGIVFLQLGPSQGNSLRFSGFWDREQTSQTRAACKELQLFKLGCFATTVTKGKLFETRESDGG